MRRVVPQNDIPELTNRRVNGEGEVDRAPHVPLRIVEVHRADAELVAVPHERRDRVVVGLNRRHRLDRVQPECGVLEGTRLCSAVKLRVSFTERPRSDKITTKGRQTPPCRTAVPY